MSLWVVVGGQFGGEGKGKISAFITRHEDIDVCIRCGGPNSGHSFVTDSGDTVLLRQLPTGYIRPQTRLLIPAGAFGAMRTDWVKALARSREDGKQRRERRRTLSGLELARPKISLCGA